MSTTVQLLANARQRADRAQKRLDYLDKHSGAPDDPGAVSGIRRTSTARQQRQAEVTWGQLLNAQREAELTRKAVERLEAKHATEQREAAQDQSATIDLDRLRPGDAIRHRRHGISEWLQVRRLNAKTITCEPRFEGSGPPKVRRDDVLETSHQEDA